MEREASIVAKLRDEVSANANRMGDSVKRFSKDAEETGRVLQALGKRQEEIGRQMAKTQTELFDANRELKSAKAAYASLNDEASRKELEGAHQRVNKLTAGLKDYKQAAGDTQRAMRELHEQERKAQNQSGSSAMGGEVSMMGQLAKAGLTKMVGDSLSGVANSFMGSAFGSEAGSMFSATLSGAASGAALGSLAGPVVAAIGGAIGGVLGAVNGATQVFTQRDEAFKGYVQENAEAQLANRNSDIQSGSAVAAGRQQDTIAFNTLLGDGVGDKYLEDLRTMAAKTPMEYSDLTGMSRSLATGFKDDPERMLGLMESVGNAGSAVGIDAGGMNMMATAMSRMQSSGKVTLEYLNLIQERGVDAVGMLADGMGVAKGEVYDLISKGKLDGVAAVQTIQDKMDEMYGGAMERQSQTFGGLSSTLADANTEMQNAYGEGYNEERGVGIKEQTDWLSGASGEAQMEANRVIGAFQASLENEKERLIREAVDETMAGDEYQKAKAEGDAAEMGRLIMAAKVRGQSEYNATDGAQTALESELELAASIRNDAASDDAYWDAGRRKGESYTKGLASAIRLGSEAYISDYTLGGGAPTMTYDSNFGYTYDGTAGGTASGTTAPKPHAAGLNRVPRDNYPALLHEDERVLTAREARQQDGGGGGGDIKIDLHDNTFTGTTAEQAGQIMKIIAREVAKAKRLSAPK